MQYLQEAFFVSQNFKGWNEENPFGPTLHYLVKPDPSVSPMKIVFKDGKYIDNKVAVGRLVVCDTEKDVFDVLGLDWKEPHERNVSDNATEVAEKARRLFEEQRRGGVVVDSSDDEEDARPSKRHKKESSSRKKSSKSSKKKSKKSSGKKKKKSKKSSSSDSS